LIGFYGNEAEELRNIGYVAECGKSGFEDGIHSLPSPHEKDLIFYDTSRHYWKRKGKRTEMDAGTSLSLVEHIPRVIKRGGWVVCFLDKECKDVKLEMVGLGDIQLEPIPESTRFLPAYNIGQYWDPIMQMLDRFKDSLRVHYSIDRRPHPAKDVQHSLWVDELERGVAFAIKPGEAIGRYLLLPSFESNLHVVKYLLSDVLPELAPDLFPGRGKLDWLDEDHFDPPGIAAVKEKMTTLEKETKQTKHSSG